MTTEKDKLVAYYAQRAASYDEIYQRPARQADQASLFEQVAQLAKGHDVLELACGTGYWTKTLATQANSVLALDINQDMLQMAQARQLPAEKVSFALADIYNLPASLNERKFSLCFAGFWWSHVKRSEQEAFIAQLKARVGANCQLVLIDNSYVDGDSVPIARTDAEGNTYQIRDHVDGGKTDIVKNFPSDSALRKRFANLGREIRITRLQYFWLLSCRLK